ncbi:HAD hydrolase-like protein [Actinomycetospora endophytica]|uniref:HAD hydrolase-like protein n=1 Tax=Actinomycetospora endophytica TaxID=2291215 RepID=A0ABS8P6M9_9PSEU|nr:HAD family hydrolase [Actinomycetospora endophytica]MCD2193898.1 HAD hydrolase-like protein [Actinomycetospora endophytica]
MNPPWACVVWDLDGTLLQRGAGRPVDGVEGVLAAWSAAGVEMAVATSASTTLARRVVDELGWSGWFGHVAGSAPGVGGKDAVIAEALLGLGRVLPDGARDAAMVGDSPADVWAAHVHGLTAVGVTWSGTPADALADADLLWPRPDAAWHPPS